MYLATKQVWQLHDTGLSGNPEVMDNFLQDSVLLALALTPGKIRLGERKRKYCRSYVQHVFICTERKVHNQIPWMAEHENWQKGLNH